MMPNLKPTKKKIQVRNTDLPTHKNGHHPRHTNLLTNFLGAGSKLVFGHGYDSEEEDSKIEGNVIKISYQIHLGLQSFQVPSPFIP